MDELNKYMKDSLEKLKAECAENYDKLKSDCRDDEARIEKIKSNIAGIYDDVLNVSYRQAKASKGSNDEKLQKMIETYLAFFSKIPAAWEESLQEAKEHDDFETVFIETEKIKISGKIKKIFEKLTEGNYAG